MAEKKGVEEIELKARIPEEALDSVREKLLQKGFSRTVPRNLEVNCLFDFPDRRIFASGSAFRLRSYNGRQVLTWKGPARPNPGLKIREEVETDVASREQALLILEKLGLQPVFEYSKYREKFQARFSREIEVCIDETRAGYFLEIEGSEDDISLVVEMLKLDASSFVNATYVELLREGPVAEKDPRP